MLFRKISASRLWVYIKDMPKNSVIHVRLIAWHKRFKQLKVLKKDIRKELMTEAWHSTRGRDWCMSEEANKEIKPVFNDKVGKW